MPWDANNKDNILDTVDIPPEFGSSEDYTVFEVLNHRYHRYYIYNPKKPIGEGGFGVVYKAFPIVEDTHNGKKRIDWKKPFAIKRLQSRYDNYTVSPERAQEERDNNQYYHKTEPLIKHKGNFYIITEFFPGRRSYKVRKNLNNSTDNRAISLPLMVKSLDFYGRIQLLFHISQSVHLIHQTTSQKPAHIHRDLKGDNILIDVVTKEKDKKLLQINTAIIDFGFTVKAELTPKQQCSKGIAGVPVHMAPEAYQKKIVCESDVYSILPVFLIFLNATDPFANKDKVKDKKYQAEYNFSDLFTELDIPKFIVGKSPDFKINIEPIIKKFLERMAAQEFSKRANSDEMLRFFTTLNHLCCAHKSYTESVESKDSDQQKQAVDAQKIDYAKLALLANGLWQCDLFAYGISTFEQFNWERELDFCNTVINKFHQNQLNKAILTQLLSKTVQAEVFDVEVHCKNLVVAIEDSEKTSKLSDAAAEDQMDSTRWAQAAGELMKLAQKNEHSDAIEYIKRVCPEAMMKQASEQQKNCPRASTQKSSKSSCSIFTLFSTRNKKYKNLTKSLEQSNFHCDKTKVMCS